MKIELCDCCKKQITNSLTVITIGNNAVVDWNEEYSVCEKCLKLIKDWIKGITVGFEIKTN